MNQRGSFSLSSAFPRVTFAESQIRGKGEKNSEKTQLAFVSDVLLAAFTELLLGWLCSLSVCLSASVAMIDFD